MRQGLRLQHFLEICGAFAVLVSLSGCYGVPGSPTSPALSVGTEGGTCYAGNYVCPLSVPGTRGTTCSCPGLGAPSYGIIN
jgi:hypothetical protein